MKASHICLALALSIGIAKADNTIFAGYVEHPHCPPHRALVAACAGGGELAPGPPLTEGGNDENQI